MSNEAPSLWVTRSSPFNLLTAQRLRAMGFHVLTVPLLEVRQLPCEHMLARPDLLAFTSVHGVRHHPFSSAWADLPVLAVGDTTAAAARRRGYRDVRSAEGAVEQLQALALRSAAAGSKITHFGAQEPAGDLSGYLRQRGFEAAHVPVYETAPTIEGVNLILGGSTRVDAVLVHSPKAGSLLATLIERTGWSGTVACLSEACAATLRHFPCVEVRSALRPTERSLLKVVAERWVRNRPKPADSLSPRHQAVFQTSGAPRAVSANDNCRSSPHPA